MPHSFLLLAVLLAQVGFLTSCKRPSESPAENTAPTTESAPEETPPSVQAAPPAVAQKLLVPILLENEDMEFKAAWTVQRELPGSSGGGSLWARLHALRIRSPFGQDSLYIYATQMAPAGSSMIAHFQDGQPATAAVTQPPYEISIPSVAVDQMVKLQTELRNPNGSKSWIGPFELPGIPRS